MISKIEVGRSYKKDNQHTVEVKSYGVCTTSKFINDNIHIVHYQNILGMDCYKEAEEFKREYFEIS